MNYSREQLKRITEGRSPASKRLLKQALALILFIVLWQILTIGEFLPTPVEVFWTLLELIQLEAVQQNTLKTTYRVLISSFLSLFIGVAIGVAGYFNKTVSDIMNTFFYPSQFVAEAVFALVAIAILGLNPVIVYIITIIAIVPNVFVTVQEGLEKIDDQLLEFGQTYTESKIRLFRHIIIPQLLPYIMAGFLRAHAVAWDIVATTEIFLATSGLGYLIQDYYRLLDLPKLFATVIIIIVLGLVSDRIFRIIKRRIEHRYMHGSD